MSLDIPKGLGANPHQRMIFWAPKTKVLKFQNATCTCMYMHAYTCMIHVYSCVPKNPNFDYWVGPNSNGHNSLNISPN